MAKPKVLIIRTAGTNCDKETEQAFQSAGALTHLWHINHIKEKGDFSQYQIIALPGGFSYGDDLGAGKILALEFVYWLKDRLKAFIDKGGLMVGICNGFQVLVKTGILPDLDFVQKVTLTDNDSQRFEDRWVYLKSSALNPQLSDKKIDCVWLRKLPEVFALPIAHGEGKFYADSNILDRIEARGQAVLRYVNADGSGAVYPLNPNGSLNAIAGICDQSGRILGLMPHPERCVFDHHIPQWQSSGLKPHGWQFFKNAVDYFV